jgi:methylphosphotriester-DNA--protein-cysteine methyltransferase
MVSGDGKVLRDGGMGRKARLRDAAGVTPLELLESIRLERARKSLERGDFVTRAADDAGFRSGMQLWRAWRKQWGGPPRDAMKASNKDRSP